MASREQQNGWSRREFLRGPTLAGTAAILGLKSGSAAAEPPVCTKNLDSDIAVMETAQHRLWDDASSSLNRA